jgi:hypothetical protein
VHNLGTVEPLAKLVVTGNYDQGPLATLGVDQHSMLAVTKHAALDGALVIGKVMPPTQTGQFTIMTFGTRAGLFNSVSQGFRLSVGAHTIDVTVS